MMEAMRVIERSVRAARRRLLLHHLLRTTAVSLSAALAAALAWLLAEPWLMQDASARLRWFVLAGLLAAALLATAVHVLRTLPSRARAALELDGRFGLSERVVTALWLPEELRQSEAGQALLHDAALSLQPVRVAERFPLRPQRSAWLVPALAAALAFTGSFYQPDTACFLAANDARQSAGAEGVGQKLPTTPPRPVVPFTRQRPPELAQRAGKSEQLLELEKQLDKLMEKWAKDPPAGPPQAREKVAELTSMEERLQKFLQEKVERLAQLEDRFRQLEKLSQEPDFNDGPLDKLAAAMAQGDLQRAKDEIDELKKKARDKSFMPEDAAKMRQQMEKLQAAAKRLAQDEERQRRVREKLAQARQDGRERDAEMLERELKQMEQEAEQVRDKLEKLAEQMSRCEQCLAQGQIDQLAAELGLLGDQLKGIEDDLADLDDAGEHLQRLREELKKACSQCAGGGSTEDPNAVVEKDWGTGKGVGAGRRQENPNAASSSMEERVRGLFDPKGKKSFGGSVRGQAFSKKSTAELGPEIERAAQEASRGLDAQQIPRDAQPVVREYMQAISGKK